MQITLSHSPDMQQRSPDAVADHRSTPRQNTTPRPSSSANVVVPEARLMKKSRLQHALTDAERLQTIDCDREPKETTSKDNQWTIGSDSGSSSTFPLSTVETVLARNAIHDSVLTKMHILIMENAANSPLLERVRLAWTHELPTSVALSTPFKRLKESDVRCCYAIGKCIGKGSFGCVYAAKHRVSGSQVVIKSYVREQGASRCCYLSHTPKAPRQHASTPRTRSGVNESDALEWTRVRQEVRMMAALPAHPSIVQFIEAFETPTHMHVVMERAPKGSRTLCDFLHAQPHQKLSETRARSIFRALCAAIAVLHAQHVIHRDLKLENVLVLESRGEVRVKVIDFGFSQFDKHQKHPTSHDPAKKKHFCGTPPYMAPEVVTSERYDGQMVDVWALGVILFVLLTGTFPFQGHTFLQLYQNIRSLQIAIPATLSPDAQTLLRAIFVLDPRKRPRVCDLQTHPWMASTNVHATPRALGDRGERFNAFTQWRDAKLLVCDALVSLYGLDRDELVAALRENRRNGVTAFLNLAMLASRDKFELLCADATELKMQPAPQARPKHFEDLLGQMPTHKQHLETLIGLVKASLLTS